MRESSRLHSAGGLSFFTAKELGVQDFCMYGVLHRDGLRLLKCMYSPSTPSRRLDQVNFPTGNYLLRFDGDSDQRLYSLPANLV